MKQGAAPLVSVLTTAYNEEQYLRECIESVLAQSYLHWDYTIVDNCSTDRTSEIALEYAAKDRRIRIVRNEATVPVIANLNIACRQISPQAKYCKVVAGDDWIFPECIEKMVSLAEAHPNVAIVGAYRLIGATLDAAGLPFPTNVAVGRDVCRAFLLGGGYVFGVPTSLLYRADVIRGRPSFFNELQADADVDVCLELLKDYDFGFVHQVLTFMRTQENTHHSIVRDNNLYLAEKLGSLVKHGPTFLDTAELKRTISRQMDLYYRYLGSQLLNRRGWDFWRLHKRCLAELGYHLNGPRVSAHALISAVERVADWLHWKL